MSDDYEVGRGRPPRRTRFKKGTSGNPKGRPKGVKNFKTDFREEMAQPVRVSDGHGVETVSSQRAAIKRLREKALKGDQRALADLLKLAERHGEDVAEEREHELAKHDHEIIDRYVERRIREHEARKAVSQSDLTTEDNQ